MRCFKGKILTLDQDNHVYKYLVEDKGRIVYVGDDLPQVYQNVRCVNLGKRALLPSFVDSHQHFASFATFFAGLDVKSAKSNEEIIEAIREFAKKTEQTSIIAFGASAHAVKEQRLLTREELDLACSDKEVMMVKYDGHACVLNSKLLKKLDKKLSPLRGYHPESGEMNQDAFFVVSNYITNSISIPDLFRNMQKAVDYQASKGIGCIHTVSGVGFLFNLDITMEQVFGKSLSNGFQLRVFPQSLNVRSATIRKLPRIGGCFQCALDGCFGSHDAAMNEPYVDREGGNGVLYYTDEVVTAFCKKANRLGLQIELHAIGDQAFDQAARALEAALIDYPRDDHRHGIIHACLPTKAGIEICKKYKIQLPMQSAFIDWKQEPDSHLIEILGEERAAFCNPIASVAKEDIMISFGSDGPCTDPDPIVWIDKAVNNPNKKEAVTVLQALRMASYNGYYATFDEKDRGSLEVGKIADMVILSESPFDVEERALKDLKVEKLILAGKAYKSCKEALPKALLHALL